ncbi:MAG: HPP family protein, partial [bacterium]
GEPPVEEAVLEARNPDDILAVSRLLELELRRPLRVEDVMTPLTYRVYPHTPVQEVLDLIARRRLEAVPVVDENLQLLGLVSAADALQHMLRSRRAARGSAGGAATVRDVMTRSVLCVSEDQSLLDAAQVMATRSVGQLPVVREGEVVGFLSREEVLFALSGAGEENGGGDAPTPDRFGSP